MLQCLSHFDGWTIPKLRPPPLQNPSSFKWIPWVFVSVTNNPTQWCVEGRNMNKFGNDNRGSDDENEGYLRGRNGVRKRWRMK